MNWHYTYNPYLLPMLASAALTAALAISVWRRRFVPGALPLALAMLFSVPWSLGAALELAAVDVPAQIFWVKFQALWPQAVNIAVFCFVLEYANLNRWLSRPILTLLAIAPLLQPLLIVTNDAHHLIWIDFPFDGYVRPVWGAASSIFLGYANVLAAIQAFVLLRLFARSPLHRWSVVLILTSRLLVLIAYRLDAADRNPFAPMNATVLALAVAAALFSVALFHFRMLDPISAARKAAIDQMHEGMLVLDTQGRIVDLNPAAEEMIGTRRARVIGRAAAQALAAFPALVSICHAPLIMPTLARIGAGESEKCYEVSGARLTQGRGEPVGQLLLLRDVTERERTQAQLFAQQRTLAIVQERAHLARELHDSAAQVLSYVSLQAQAIRKWVRDGDTATAQDQLTRLANAAQDAHAELRESILSLKVGLAPEWSFFTALQQHLDACRDHYGIRTEVTIPPRLDEQTLAPSVGVQLLRVIQEAMTNARKHGRAHCVQLVFEVDGRQARVVIADDGRGFEPDSPHAGGDNHLGSAFMHERMMQIGGSMTIHSQPGAGTQVVLQFPLNVA